MNQCWNIVNWTLRNKLQWDQSSYIFIQENILKMSFSKWTSRNKLQWDQNSYILIQKNTFENVVFEMNVHFVSASMSISPAVEATWGGGRVISPCLWHKTGSAEGQPDNLGDAWMENAWTLTSSYWNVYENCVKLTLKVVDPVLIKTVFPRYGYSHVKDKTVLRPSYL